jgi:hypothetical protein
VAQVILQALKRMKEKKWSYLKRQTDGNDFFPEDICILEKDVRYLL